MDIVLALPPNVLSRVVRVLLVDDDTELGELVREYLAREGFSLEVEADGTRAVERVVAGDSPSRRCRRRRRPFPSACRPSYSSGAPTSPPPSDGSLPPTRRSAWRSPPTIRR